MACSSQSESRCFFILDSLSPGSSVWTKKALMRLGNTLAVTLKQPCPVGLAALSRSKPGQAAQLSIVLRLGRTFQAREFLSCIKRLPAPPADAAACDGTMLGSALLALMQHMQKVPARADCHSHLFILSSSFASWASNPKMHKVLQLLSLQAGYSFHFLEITGPEAELQAGAAAAAAGPSSASNQPPPPPPLPQQATGTSDASSADFHRMLSSLALSDSITYDAVVADGEAATDLMCQSWLRELLTPARGSSSSRPSTAATPDLILRFGSQTLPCELQQYILQLDPWLLPAQICPCHHLPMHPDSGSSSIAAAHAAAAAAGSDVGSMAALLVLPEASPWSCCVTGQAVMQPASSCRSDASILQLGRHTQLAMPPAGNSTNSASKLGALQALSLPHDQACLLSVQHAVAPSAVDSMLLFGMPLLLTPPAAGSNSSSAAGAAAQAAQPEDAAAGLVNGRDQGQTGQHQQQEGAAAASASEAAMLMRALCQHLLEQQQVLLAVSSHDLLRRIQLPLQQWYMLQPTADGSSLLLRWLAAREQLLPPKQRDRNALGSTVGASAACMEEQVVLLDAEQLEAVRVSLASLTAGISSGSAGGVQITQEHAAGAVSGHDDGPAAAAADDNHSEQQPQQQVVEPLLLSCGLDAWVSAVLDASSATYTPPAAVPPPAAAPLAGPQASSALAAAAPVPHRQVQPQHTFAAAGGPQTGQQQGPGGGGGGGSGAPKEGATGRRGRRSSAAAAGRKLSLTKV